MNIPHVPPHSRCIMHAVPPTSPEWMEIKLTLLFVCTLNYLIHFFSFLAASLVVCLHLQWFLFFFWGVWGCWITADADGRMLRRSSRGEKQCQMHYGGERHGTKGLNTKGKLQAAFQVSEYSATHFLNIFIREYISTLRTKLQTAQSRDRWTQTLALAMWSQ